MAGLWEWLYRNRDPVSYGMAVAMILLALWPRPALQPAHVQPSMELMAMLEEPSPPKEKETPPKIPEPQPRPVLRPLPQPVEAPPAAQPVEALPPKPVVQEAPAPVVQRVVEPVRAPAPVPAPPKPVVQEQPKSAVVSAHYEQYVLAALEKAKRYPTSREARLTHPQGVVRVWLEINRDGQLTGVGVVDSSGSNLLDSEALHTVRSISFPAFPEQAYVGQSLHRFVVGLKYEINSDH